MDAYMKHWHSAQQELAKKERCKAFDAVDIRCVIDIGYCSGAPHRYGPWLGEPFVTSSAEVTQAKRLG